MPKKIPADWKNLWVNEVLTRGQWGRCSGLDILRIQRVGHSPKIYAVWMPRKEDDPRPNAGRCASGKRLPEKFSTGEVDPRSAAKKAKRNVSDVEILHVVTAFTVFDDVPAIEEEKYRRQ